MKRDLFWRSYGWYTLITGLFAVPLFLLPGPTYYLSLVLVLAWLEVLAIRLRQTTGPRRSPAAWPEPSIDKTDG